MKPTVFGEHFFSNEADDLFLEVFNEKRTQRAIKNLRERHQPTYSHSVGVARLMAEFAINDTYNLGDSEKIIAVRQALLHDLGKLSVSLTILDNNSRMLNKNEWVKIKKHSADGFHRYAQSFNAAEALPILLHHTFQANCYPEYPDQENIARSYGISIQELTSDKTIESSILLAVVDSIEARFPEPPDRHINGVRGYSNRHYPVSDLPLLIRASFIESGRAQELDKTNYLEKVLIHSSLLLSRIDNR